MSIFSKKLLLNNRKDNKQYHAGFSSGLTMIELLIIIAIVSLLIMLFFSSSSIYIGRARDSERKSDLEKIKVAFEDYYNDNECYPPAEALNDCDGTSLSPYLNKIPCDPETDDPYRYYRLSANSCSGFRVLTALYDDEDPAVIQLNCHEELGCDPNEPGYNYGVSSGALVGDNNYWIFYGGDVNKFICLPSGIDKYECGVSSVVPEGCTGYTDSVECDEACNETTNCN